MDVLKFPVTDEVEAYAEKHKVRLVDAALILNTNFLKKESIWPKTQHEETIENNSRINLCVSKSGDLLTELTKSICKSVQFPQSTAFLHGLGCIAGACAKSFKFKYHGGEMPLNMYVVTAQPPATGKSGVHEKFAKPIQRAYEEINSQNRELQIKLKKQIAKLSKEIDDADVIGGDLSASANQKIKELANLEEELRNTPIWNPTITDATIEATEIIAGKQTGYFCISSAESDSINNLLGLTYGDQKAKKSNHGLVLNGWDGEWFSSARVTRDSYNGFVRGSISVIAQDASIDSLLSFAAQGRGVAERFLLLREPCLLGYRNHLDYDFIDKDLLARYEKLIKNIVDEHDVLIDIPRNVDELIKSYRHGVENELRDSGRYSNNLMTGFIGKADKHIIKIALTLFVIDKWQNLATRAYELDESYVYWAISIFEELAKMYENSAGDLGYAGDDAEVKKMIDVFTSYSEKGKLKVSIESIRVNYAKVKPFNLIRGFKAKLKNVILPKLSDLNYCVFDDNNIYINPRLK